MQMSRKGVGAHADVAIPRDRPCPSENSGLIQHARGATQGPYSVNIGTSAHRTYRHHRQASVHLLPLPSRGSEGVK